MCLLLVDSEPAAKRKLNVKSLAARSHRAVSTLAASGNNNLKSHRAGAVIVVCILTWNFIQLYDCKTNVSVPMQENEKSLILTKPRHT